MGNVCHRWRGRVAFSDTDASGRVHFSRVLGYVECAEHEFLEGCGIGVYDKEAGGWPRVNISCDYKEALAFRDEVEVVLRVEKLGRSSVRWGFEIFKDEGVVVASGEMVTVRVEGAGAAVAIPAEERKVLEGGDE